MSAPPVACLVLPYRGYKSGTDRSVQQCAALASNAPRAAHGTGEAKATLLMDPTYFERLIAALWTRCSPRPRWAPALGDGWMKAPSPVPADRVVSMRAPESPRESAQVAGSSSARHRMHTTLAQWEAAPLRCREHRRYGRGRQQ